MKLCPDFNLCCAVVLLVCCTLDIIENESLLSRIFEIKYWFKKIYYSLSTLLYMSLYRDRMVWQTVVVLNSACYTWLNC